MFNVKTYIVMNVLIVCMGEGRRIRLQPAQMNQLILFVLMITE